MGHGEYGLSELSEQAAVPVRTVRYYIQQGLLPGPGERGPRARYGQRHLQRLLLIKRLRDQDMPLAKIRGLLESVDDDEVRTALATYPGAPEGSGPSAQGPSAQGPSASGSSALAYIRAVRGAGATIPATTGAVGDPWSWSYPLRSGQSESGEALRSQWERIALAPDIELHVRRPLSRSANRRVERLLKLARDLFDGEEGL